MINVSSYFSSQELGTGETIYIPFGDLEVSLEERVIITELEIPEVTVELSESSLEAELQDDIFQAILYDDREVSFG